MNDHVNAADAIAAARQVAMHKARLSRPQMLLRGVLAGALLGYATSLVMVILAQGVPPIVGALGAQGWAAAVIKGVLCNWMVTLAAVLAFASRSTIGKIAAMWLPIFTFFAHGYEHSVVNMFLIPAGMLLGAPVSAGAWWFWNQI